MKQAILTSCVFLLFTSFQKDDQNQHKQPQVSAEDTIAKIKEIKRRKDHIIKVNDDVLDRKKERSDSLTATKLRQKNR